MPLVRNTYNRQDDGEEDVDLKYAPPAKRFKTCAPDSPKKQQVAPTPLQPFVPLEIVPISSTNLSQKGKSHGLDSSTSLPSAKRNKETLAEKKSLWTSSDVMIHGHLLSQPHEMASIIAFTAKMGPKAARQARKVRNNLESFESSVTRILWCPYASSLLASSSADGSVKIFDIIRTSGRKIQEFNFFEGIRDVCFSTDKSSLLCGGYGGQLHRTDIESGKRLLNMRLESEITNLCEKENLVVASLSSGSILAFDSREPLVNESGEIYCPSKTSKDGNGKFVRRICGLPGSVSSFDFVSSSRIVISCDPSNRSVSEYAISIWDWDAGREICCGIWKSSPVPAYQVLKHPNESHIAVLTSSNKIHTFSSEEPFRMKKKKSFEFEVGLTPSGYRSQMCLSHDGTILYAGSGSGTVHAFDYYSGGHIGTIENEKKSPISALCHHPILNSTIAVGTRKGEVKVYQ